MCIRDSYYFVGIDNARFKRPTGPGDQLVLEAEVERHKAGIYRFKAWAKVDDEVVAEGNLMCTVRRIED